MSLLTGLNSSINLGRIGSCWQPKSDRIRVGRDVGAFTATTFTEQTARNTVIGNGDDVALKSEDLFSRAKSAAQQGFGIRNFRAVSDQDLKDGAVKARGLIRSSGDYSVSFSDGALNIKNGDYSASIQDGTITIYQKHAEKDKAPTLVMKAAITDDSRLVWNEDGTPELLTGNAARTGGILQAQSENEVILSVSGSNVKAGEGSVVWNLSGKAGNYSGGNNVSYLGTYNGGSFSNIEGSATFAGYFNQTSFSDISGNSKFSGVFDEASIALEKGHGTFSGYFSASRISGATTNTMSGMFLNACDVRGGDGDDNFNGRFIGGTVDGGEGDNAFGYGNLSLMRKLVAPGIPSPQSYMGVEADFINATVTAGSGKDRVNGVSWGSSFDLGQGDDSADGIFSHTIINGGGGNDALRAEYAAASTFNTGDGNNSVTLKTAISNSIITGDGVNAVMLGLNDVDSSATAWQTRDEYFNRTRPRETGELANNTVDTQRGESTVTVNNGETSRQAITRNRHGGENNEAEAEMDGAAVPQKEELASATDTAMCVAIDKYRKVFGMDPQNAGETAVSINYGAGAEESFMSAAREDAGGDRKEAGMMRIIRRYGVDGAASWERWN